METRVYRCILINQLEKLEINAPIEQVIQAVIDTAKMTRESLEERE